LVKFVGLMFERHLLIKMFTIVVSQ
jgi:hypothetical protein